MSDNHLTAVVLTLGEEEGDARPRDVAMALREAGAAVHVLVPGRASAADEHVPQAINLLRVPVGTVFSDLAGGAGKQTRVRRARAAIAGRLRRRDRDAGLRRTYRRHQARIELARMELRGAGAGLRRARLERRAGATGSRPGLLTRLTLRWRWQSLLPEFRDLELAFGPAIDRLAPGLMYVLDAPLLPVAAAAQLRADGTRSTLIFDPARLDLSALPLRYGVQRSLASVDAVVARSQAHAALLERELGVTPTVLPEAALPLVLGSGSPVAEPLRTNLPDGARGIIWLPDPGRPLAGDAIVDVVQDDPDLRLFVVSPGGLDKARAAEAKSAGKRTRVIPGGDEDLVAALVREVDVVVDTRPADLAGASVEAAARAAGRELVGNGQSLRRALDRRPPPPEEGWDAAQDALVALARKHGVPAPPPPAPVRLAVGPRNGNGQAWAWCEALRVRHPDVATEVFAAEFSTGKLDMRFPEDVRIPLEHWKARDWQLWWTRHLFRAHTHVLLEQGLTAAGWLNGKFFPGDLPMLENRGIRTGLIFRGSEIRNPARHAAAHEWSPFQDPSDPLTVKLQEHSDGLSEMVEAYDGPVFVTTLDLLDDLPQATWLPHTIDLDRWRPDEQRPQRRVPTVLHAPSREQMKGSAWVDAACEPLAALGRIRYVRLQGVPYEEMPAVIRDADIVVDQLALASYGVLALQAMASGCVVVGHVAEGIRERLGGALPIVEAEPPRLRAALERLLDQPQLRRSHAEAGRRYAETFHSGERSAQVLAGFLGLGAPREPVADRATEPVSA